MKKSITLSAELVTWMANAEWTPDTQAIVSHLTGLQIGTWPNPQTCHPAHLVQLAPCALLLEQVPELKARFREMATASAWWAALVDNWDKLVAELERTCPPWRDREARFKHWQRFGSASPDPVQDMLRCFRLHLWPDD